MTRISQDGNVRRRLIDTTGRIDAGRWENLLSQAPASPPPYRPAPGDTVYQVSVDDQAFMVTEDDINGGLRELVVAVLAEGEEV